MKQLALEVVARTLDPAQTSLLAEEFDRADTNHNGEVGIPTSISEGLACRATLWHPVDRS